jgi:alkylation response protein AidB-like acyl-CoA dehydrogenase
LQRDLPRRREAASRGTTDMTTPRSSQFALHADDQAVLDAADKFARKVLAPLSGRMDNEEWWPPEAFSQIGAAGFMGATVPTEYGGAGMDLFSSGLVCQAFARWNPALALSWAAHDNLCVNNIFRNASEAQRRRYLPGLCNGSQIGALGLTEPGAGSDALGGMRTTARRDGDHYVLNGTKIYITNGPVADVLLVYAKSAPERGAKGISAFIVEKGFPGFRVAQKLVKMGFRGSQTGELVFEDCRVPITNLVGPENDGVKIVMSGLDLERALVASLCVGIAERARTERGLRRHAPAVRQADRQLPDGAGAAGRDVHRDRGHEVAGLAHAGRCERSRDRRRRPRPGAQAHGRVHPLRRGGLQPRSEQGRSGARRQRLHLGVRDQQAVSLHQDPRDRRRHIGSAQADHRRGTVTLMTAPLSSNASCRHFEERP